MNTEIERLEELKAYKVLDTSAEKELDELAEVASVICGTPISLISLVDNKRQWFKSKKGLDLDQTPRKDAFCQHTLNKPKEIMVVNDSHQDDRFKENPLVTGDPNIRFYAGAPLETPNGNVLGTLCVIDSKPRMISDEQKNALQILAKKAMDYLNTRKTIKEQESSIEDNALHLKKLTNNLPIGVFQLKMELDGKFKFEFLGEGMQRLHLDIGIKDWVQNPKLGLELIHEDDLELFKESLAKSTKNLTPWRVEYRVAGTKKWHMVSAFQKKQKTAQCVGLAVL